LGYYFPRKIAQSSPNGEIWPNHVALPFGMIHFVLNYVNEGLKRNENEKSMISAVFYFQLSQRLEMWRDRPDTFEPESCSSSNLSRGFGKEEPMLSSRGRIVEQMLMLRCSFRCDQWKRISCKQSARWQHLSGLKASALFFLQKNC